MYEMHLTELNYRFPKGLFIQGGITALLLLVECTLYWYIQGRITNKVWVWLHITGLYLALLVLPLVTIILIMYAGKIYGTSTIFNFIYRFGRIRNFLFWFLTATGHILFILTLIIAFRKKKDNGTDNDAGDVLPGIYN